MFLIDDILCNPVTKANAVPEDLGGNLLLDQANNQGIVLGGGVPVAGAVSDGEAFS